MSEAERLGQIRLSVNQEVFIEQIMDGDSIDDANVATEVTSFERFGDAYVLEGAIVFAGYLARKYTGSQRGATSASEGYARHVHHRMPFVLRVPIQHQPRGVVNVASRIADWQLEVLGDGWLRVQAELTVTGLNGKRGFYFQCGAQEEGDSDFGRQERQAPASEDSSSARASLERTAEIEQRQQSAEASTDALDPVELASADGEPWRLEDVDRDAATESSAETAARLSQARGGAESETAPDTKVSAAAGSAEPDAAPPVLDGSSARNELANLDRYLTGNGEDDAKKTHQQGSLDPREPSEYEFEHQLDTSQLVPVENQREAVAAVRDGEAFVPSRGFTETGFHPTSGFMPTLKVGAASSPAQTEVDDVKTGLMDESGGIRSAEGEALVDTSLWSFVDFNAPSGSFMLRHVIVLDDESVDSVVQRAGCSEEALFAANQLRGDGVYPGLVLRVPVRKAPELPVRIR